MEYNLILNITTYCNFDCSYCDVIKDKKNLSNSTLLNLYDFVRKNASSIGRFKFFWWEPLLAFNNIKEIIKNTNNYINNNYEIVTNTSLLNNDIWIYLRDYFSLIFFSIDNENKFDYDYVCSFINRYNLLGKLYFNLIINPWFEKESYEQFLYLYKNWFKRFNILPVYFTKDRSKLNLTSLAFYCKKILDLSLKDKNLKLYGFKENNWEKTSLINNSLFIDVDWNIYFSDIVSTFSAKFIKKDFYLWDLKNIDLSNLKIDFNYFLNKIKLLEIEISKKGNWQSQLHKLMDYFSVYLNKRNAK